jgi:hypothetical protein
MFPSTPATPAAPAIPHQELLPRVQEYCFHERIVRILARELGFADLRYRSHQICFVADFARQTAGLELSMKQLTRASDCHATRVKAALANGFEEPKSRRRHFVFDDDSEEEILSWIEERAEKSRPATRTDILYYCEVKYSRSVTRRWVDSFVLHHRDRFSETKSPLQEGVRLEVPRVFLDDTISCLR